MLEAGPPWEWLEILERALMVKIQVVQEDPLEKGRRAALNLGHTAGHALERLTSYSLPHGEAVAMGLVVAASIAVERGRCDQNLLSRLEETLHRLGLSTRWAGDFSAYEVLEAMAHDKKRQAGRLRWVLPTGIGVVEIADDVPEEVVIRALVNNQAR